MPAAANQGNADESGNCDPAAGETLAVWHSFVPLEASLANLARTRHLLNGSNSTLKSRSLLRGSNFEPGGARARDGHGESAGGAPAL
jgi:hypothetical protein